MGQRHKTRKRSMFLFQVARQPTNTVVKTFNHKHMCSATARQLNPRCVRACTCSTGTWCQKSPTPLSFPFRFLSDCRRPRDNLNGHRSGGGGGSWFNFLFLEKCRKCICTHGQKEGRKEGTKAQERNRQNAEMLPRAAKSRLDC